MFILAATIWGWSLFELYIASIAITFCLSMMGYGFLKQMGIIPEQLPVWIGTLIVSAIPVANVFITYSILKSVWLSRRNPQIRKKQQEMMKEICDSAGWTKKYEIKNQDSTDEPNDQNSI